MNEEATQRVQRAVKILNTPTRADAVELLHDAMEQFDKILTMDPENILAMNNKAYCLLHLGDYEGAIQYCYKALAIDPSYKSARDIKGWAYHHLGRHDLADKMWIDVKLR